MKNIQYIKIICLGILFGSFFSCNDRLNEGPEDTAEVSTVDYSSAIAAKAMAVGIYSKFKDIAWPQTAILSVRGDDVNAGGKGDQAPFTDTDRYSYDANFWMYNNLWESFYQRIVDYTATIEQLEKFRAGGVDPNLINQYQAECKTLRAFTLLEISRVWGKVIVMENLDQSTLTLKSKDDVMKWVSAQMDEAAPNLPDMRPNQRTDINGGVTKYTALAIKAMANLELKNYQAVADASGAIINSGKFGLFSSYYDLFKINGKLANENLLEIQYSDTASSSNIKFDTWDFYGPQKWTPVVSTAGGGWGFYEPSLKYIKFMLDRGEKERLETSVIFTPAGIAQIKSDPNYATLPSWVSNITRDGDQFLNHERYLFLSGKHYLPSTQLTSGFNSYGSNKNLIAIRYAEVLLMYAEAVSRGANATAGTAVSAVNVVRQRAGLSALSSVTSDQVMDEKYAELGMEWGIRFYDMVRLGNTAALSYDGRTFTLDKQFLPYPTAQVDKINALSK